MAAAIAAHLLPPKIRAFGEQLVPVTLANFALLAAQLCFTYLKTLPLAALSSRDESHTFTSGSVGGNADVCTALLAGFSVALVERVFGHGKGMARVEIQGAVVHKDRRSMRR